MAETMRLENLAAVAAGASAKIADFGSVPTFESTESKVEKATLVSPTAQATQGATNFATVQVRRLRGNPAVATVAASLSLGTTALVADVPVDFVLVAGVGWQAADEADLYVLQTGTGGAVPAGTEAQAEFE